MTELIDRIAIPKVTGTHGDVFAAVGLADLLSSVPHLRSVRISEDASWFFVCPEQPLTPADLRSVSRAPGYPFLKANEKTPVPKNAPDVVDYKIEKARADRLREAAKAARGKRRKSASMDAAERQVIQEEQLREDWRLLQVLNTLQGDETSNRVQQAILCRTPKDLEIDLEQGIEALRQARKSGVDWAATAVQLFTPTAAKGYSRLKPDSTDRNDKTKEGWTDSFVEWLRYRGYFRVACPFFQGPKAEHIRLLCPIPRDISLGVLVSVTRRLRSGGIWGGPPKMDSLAVLRLTELLIRHSEEYHEGDDEPYPGLSLLRRSPADVVSGVMVTHYQSLGQAKAVSAMATLALPGWFKLVDRCDAQEFLAILEEHQAVVRGLQDDYSDEIGLLVSYRRFLQQRGEAALWALVEFMEVYGCFLLRAREQKRRVRAFRVDHFGRMTMALSPSLTAILEDSGFQAVATAIRKSTVSAQAQKAMERTDYREIRYELLHDLRRKRSLPGPSPLIEGVSDFISKYNSENARRRETGRRAPRNVTTQEFAAFIGLVERHGAAVVGALLCAYGSCREPRDEETPDVVDDASVPSAKGAEGRE